MLEPIVIELCGEPVAKGRPNFASRGQGRPIAYTPAKTRNYENDLRIVAQGVMAGRPLLTGALEMTVRTFLQVPRSWSQKKQRAALAGEIRPAKKPDWDNAGKITDALSAVVFVDDAQIVDAHVHKFYSDRPRLHIEIKEAA